MRSWNMAGSCGVCLNIGSGFSGIGKIRVIHMRNVLRSMKRTFSTF